MKNVDAIIIGRARRAVPGGARFSDAGKTVAIIERQSSAMQLTDLVLLGAAIWSLGEPLSETFLDSSAW